MLVEIVSHCYSGPGGQYAKLLRYQLQSVANHRPERIEARLTVIYPEGDQPTTDVREEFRWPLANCLWLNPYPMEHSRAKYFNSLLRAIDIHGSKCASVGLSNKREKHSLLRTTLEDPRAVQTASGRCRRLHSSPSNDGRLIPLPLRACPTRVQFPVPVPRSGGPSRGYGPARSGAARPGWWRWARR